MAGCEVRTESGVLVLEISEEEYNNPGALTDRVLHSVVEQGVFIVSMILFGSFSFLNFENLEVQSMK